MWKWLWNWVMDRSWKSFEVQAGKVYFAMNFGQTGKSDSGKSSERKTWAVEKHSLLRNNSYEVITNRMLVAMCLIKAHIDEISDEHKVLVAQLCLTLCNPPGSFVHGILQARILEWVAIYSSKDLSNKDSNPSLPLCRQVAIGSMLFETGKKKSPLL